jgi:hypothetical protein
VHIHSFPFVGRLIAAGQISEIDISADRVVEGGIDLSGVHMTLDDVKVNRSQSLKERRVRLESIRSGSVYAEIGADALSSALGVPVHVVDGAVEVDVLGHTVRAPMTVQGGTLSFQVAGRTLPALTLPTTRLLPCHPNATFHGDVIRLSCRFTQVPPRLVNLLNGVSPKV